MDEAESNARAARDLAAIKAREADVRAAIDRGDDIVPVGGFTAPQLGLALTFADAKGQIWRLGADTLTRIYPPRGK